MNQATWIALLCVVGLVLALGGVILIMRYGVGELNQMFRRWIDRK